MSDENILLDNKKAATDAADLVASWATEDRYRQLIAVAVKSPLVAIKAGDVTDEQVNDMMRDGVVLLAYYAGEMYVERRDKIVEAENN